MVNPIIKPAVASVEHGQRLCDHLIEQLRVKEAHIRDLESSIERLQKQIHEARARLETRDQFKRLWLASKAEHSAGDALKVKP